MYLPVAGVDLHPLVPPAVGLGVGILSGLFGVGGGFLITPLLMWAGVPGGPAVASGLGQMVGSSSTAAIPNAYRGNVSLRLGLLVGAGGLAAGLAGVFGVKGLLQAGSFDFVLGVLYIILLTVIGVNMTLELRRPKVDDASGRPGGERERRGASQMRKDLGALTLGLAAGALSAFLGVGGGIILLPGLILLLRVPTRLAVGTSLFQVFIIALGTTVFHAWQTGTVDVVLAGLCMAGSVPGARLGVWLSHRLRTRSLKGLFGILVLGFACGMLWKTFFAERAADALSPPPPTSMGPFFTWVRSFADGHPLLYGLAAVAFAASVGGVLGFLTCGRKKEACEG